MKTDLIQTALCARSVCWKSEQDCRYNIIQRYIQRTTAGAIKIHHAEIPVAVRLRGTDVDRTYITKTVSYLYIRSDYLLGPSL